MGIPLFSVLTDIKYRAFVTCSTTPPNGKRPFQILESSAVASTVWRHELLPGGTCTHVFYNRYVQPITCHEFEPR